jgi:transcriptional regulator with XRE-family HTH domain
MAGRPIVERAGGLTRQRVQKGQPRSMRDTPHPTDVRVGHLLRERRMLLGMSQEQLGGMLGVTYQQVQKYERGTNRMGSSRLQDLCRILAVPVSYFFDSPSDMRGLSENDATFELESPALPVEVDGRETLELVRAFSRIEDPHVRRQLLLLARALADLIYRKDADGSVKA